MSSIKNIHFSSPCKEDINGMDCNIGKHCKVCKRTIIDFRDKSQEELNLIKQKNTNVCGIFSEKQVAKGYESYFQLAAATVLAIGLNGSFQNLHAQEEVDPFKFPTPTKDTVRNIEESLIVGVIINPQAEYPGGINALKNFLKENLVYPSDSVSGKVRVSFMVDISGHTKHIQITQSLSPTADSEVIRVISLMVFEPAREDGKPVNSRLSLPITFNNGKKDE